MEHFILAKRASLAICSSMRENYRKSASLREFCMRGSPSLGHEAQWMMPLRPGFFVPCRRIPAFSRRAPPHSFFRHVHRVDP
jgi:hypothetical protein